LHHALCAPTHEALQVLWSMVAIQGCKWARLIMLACVDLNANQRSQILAELDADFRERAFRRPSAEMLPDWLRHVLLGSGSDALQVEHGLLAARVPVHGDPEGHEVATASIVDLFSRVATVGGKTPTKVDGENRADLDPAPEAHEDQRSCSDAPTATSVDQLVSLIRELERSGGPFAVSQGSLCAHTAAGGGGSEALQRVFNQKVADIAVKAIFQGGQYQVTAAVPSMWGRILQLARPLRQVSRLADGPVSRLWSFGWALVAGCFRALAPMTLQEQLLLDLATDISRRGVLASREAIAQWMPESWGLQPPESPGTSVSGQSRADGDAADDSSQGGLRKKRT